MFQYKPFPHNVGFPTLEEFIFSVSPSSHTEVKDFELNYCKDCIQMTNHIEGVCQKCKKTEVKEEEPTCLSCKYFTTDDDAQPCYECKFCDSGSTKSMYQPLNK